MKIKNIATYRKLAFEFISISFAVFLGLMLNQWKDNHNNNKIVEQSLENIRIEVENNTKKVQKMLDSHKVLLANMDTILVAIDHKKITNDTIAGLSFQLINSTAWETAKLTQAIAHMDINIVAEIAGIYEYQNYYETTVKQYFLNNTSSITIESKKDMIENRKFFLDTKNFLTSKIIPCESNLLEYYKKLQIDILSRTH